MNATIFSQKSLRRKCVVTIGGLVLVNILVWAFAGIVAKRYPELLGSMVVAYTLGLRHAVDADHLAAIDNVTRKLIYQGMLTKARSRAALQARRQEEENKKVQGQALQEQGTADIARQEERVEEKEKEKEDEDEDEDKWSPPVCVGLFFSLGHSTM